MFQIAMSFSNRYKHQMANISNTTFQLINFQFISVFRPSINNLGPECPKVLDQPGENPFHLNYFNVTKL